MKKIMPLNPMPDGTCRTLKFQYHKNGFSNFIRQGSFAATGVIEIYEEDGSDQHGGRLLQDDNDAAGSAELGELPR